MYRKKILTAALALLLCPCAGAWAADPVPAEPAAMDLHGNPIAPRKADPKAPKTLAKLGEDELLLDSNWTFTMMGNQKWIQCEYDCPKGVISEGWDFEFCKTDPDCSGAVAKFQQDAAALKKATEAEQAEALEKKNAAEAEDFNQQALDAGWTLCKNPKGGGDMSCQDYLAQKGAAKGSPNGTAANSSSERKKSLFTAFAAPDSGLVDTGLPQDGGTSAPNPAVVFSPTGAVLKAGAGPAGGSTGGSSNPPSSAPNPATGVSGTPAPVTADAFAATIAFSPVLSAGAPVTNIGNTLPVTEATVKQIQDQVSGQGKSGDSLFDNRARSLPKDVEGRKKETTFFGIP